MNDESSLPIQGTKCGRPSLYFAGIAEAMSARSKKLSRRCVSYAEKVDSSGVSSDFGSAVYGGCPATSKAKTARQTRS
jgi:hypothetical protein